MENTIGTPKVREINFEPADFNVCLEIPVKLQKYEATVETKETGGIILTDRAKKEIYNAHLANTLFYQVIKIGKQVTSCKVGDWILLFDNARKILPEDETPFLMCHDGDIQGKKIYVA